ncbi:MAG: TerB N-terminal domain-containing protein [Bradymonadia bacterium]|jgi:hypothetical protein
MWYSAGQRVTIRGYKIKGGMIYVSKKPIMFGGWGVHGSVIDRKLPVIESETPNDYNGYFGWSYVCMSAESRGLYLKWLAGGRSDPDADIACVLLFLSGLEHRLCVDAQREAVTASERATIVQEILRLLKIYASRFENYFSYPIKILATEWMLYQSNTEFPNYLSTYCKKCSEAFIFILSRYATELRPLPYDIALEWLYLHPEFGLRTPSYCYKEFKELFSYRYEQKYGEGILVDLEPKGLHIEYNSGSREIKMALLHFAPMWLRLTHNLPYVRTKALEELDDLAKKCALELVDYERVIVRIEHDSRYFTKSVDPKSFSVLALLPDALIYDSPAARKGVSELERMCEDGVCAMTVEAIFAHFGINPPLAKDRKESIKIAVFAEKMGFGIIPDHRFHGIDPKLNDEVIIFPEGYGEYFYPSSRYWAHCILVHHAAIVVRADETLEPVVKATLQRLIYGNPDLSWEERTAVLAFFQWCLRYPEQAAMIELESFKASETQKKAIFSALLFEACESRNVSKEDQKHLRRRYRRLGMDAKQVKFDVRALEASNEPLIVTLGDTTFQFLVPPTPMASQSMDGRSNDALYERRLQETAQDGDGLVTVFVAPEKPTDSLLLLPAPPALASKSQDLRLNDALIESCMEETRQVQEILETVFVPIEEPVEADVTAASTASDTPLNALDKEHQDFLHCLLRQESWERSALIELCDELGIMLDGALEVLNEWSYEHVNAAIVDDGEPVFVDTELVKEIVNVN